jgi:hypothetical protein
MINEADSKILDIGVFSSTKTHILVSLTRDNGKTLIYNKLVKDKNQYKVE